MDENNRITCLVFRRKDYRELGGESTVFLNGRPIKYRPLGRDAGETPAVRGGRSLGAFGLWIRGVMLVNAESLVIDIADVVRYAAGDRRELMTGL
jgi:hypothetical protein